MYKGSGRAETAYLGVIDRMGDPIHIVDRDLRLQFCNNAFRERLRQLGLADNVMGKELLEAFPFLDNRVRGEYVSVFATGRTVVTEEQTTVRGLRFATETQKIPVFDCQGVAQVLTVIRDVTQRKKAQKTARENRRQLRKRLGETVEALAATVSLIDSYTASHQRRVARLASAIAESMRLPRNKVHGIRVAAMLHDIGKMSVPAEILSKPGRLTDMEFAMIKSHPQVGYDVVKAIEFPWPIAVIMLQHHERMDGSGYPAGIGGNEILPEARVLAVADVVEAMSSHRPHRPGLGVERALEEISRNKDVLYDPAVAETCLRLLESKGFTLI
jgi:putative nucleotidyltransferase with HDIG domain/PAS domain S-box-containing protein